MKKTIIILLSLFVSILTLLQYLNIENKNRISYGDTIKNSTSQPIIESGSIRTLLPATALTLSPVPVAISASTPESESETNNLNIKSDFSNVIFIGDSITFGFINAQNTPVKKDHVFAKIGAHVFEGPNLIGDNSELITKSCNGSVDYVFLMFGANDYGYQMSAYKKWYSELIVHIKKMFPKAKIVLQSVMPMNSTPQQPNRDQEPQKLNNIVKAVAIEENVQFLDVANSISDIKKFLATDGLHFKPELYPLWINVIVNNQKRLSE